MKVLFFDMDGTLIDSLPAALRTYEELMTFYGRSSSYEEFVALSSKSPRETILFLAERIGVDPKVLGEECTKRLSRYYMESAELFPGVREIMQEMRAENRPMFLVTAADRPIAQMMVEKHGIGDFFDHIVTTCDLHASKPHPAIYQKALELAKVKPQDAVAFEDSVVGIRSAKGAGIRSVWMNHTEGAFHPEYAHLIDHTFTDWNTVTKWLKDGTESPKS